MEEALKPYDIIDPVHIAWTPPLWTWILLLILFLLGWAIFLVYLKTVRASAPLISFQDRSLKEETLSAAKEYLRSESKEQLTYFTLLLKRFQEAEKDHSLNAALKTVERSRYAATISEDLTATIEQIIRSLEAKRDIN